MQSCTYWENGTEYVNFSVADDTGQDLNPGPDPDPDYIKYRIRIWTKIVKFLQQIVIFL
jgi:hypothetical protein